MCFSKIEKEIEDVTALEGDNGLFGKWRQAHNEEDEKSLTDTKTEGIAKDSFVGDGYISKNIKDYNGILFILKEANIFHDGSISGKDQFDFYTSYIDSSDIDTLVPLQREKMGRMASYILGNEINPETHEIKNALKQCAFMNLNKRGGDKKDQKVEGYTKKYHKFIEKQIEILAPTTIVCVGTYAYLKEYINLKNIKSNPTIIDMWHTDQGPLGGKPRNQKYKFKDANVDLYIEEFILRYNSSVILENLNKYKFLYIHDNNINGDSNNQDLAAKVRGKSRSAMQDKLVRGIDSDKLMESLMKNSNCMNKVDVLIADKFEDLQGKSWGYDKLVELFNDFIIADKMMIIISSSPLEDLYIWTTVKDKISGCFKTLEVIR